MTRSDLAVSDHVVICCPACGASETADTATLADAPTIVCRECGETWPAAPGRTTRSTGPRVEAKDSGGRELLEAQRRPLVTYSGGIDKAWADKIKGDIQPAPPRRSRFAITTGAIAAVFFMAVFLGGREAAVAVLPDLASLYAALGLPVNLDGLAIEGVAAERTALKEGARLTVRGTIRNVSGAAQAVPALTASLYDGAKVAVEVRGFDPPARMIGAGEAAPFLLALDRVPDQAREVVVRLRRPAGGAMVAAKADTATQ